MLPDNQGDAPGGYGITLGMGYWEKSLWLHSHLFCCPKPKSGDIVGDGVAAEAVVGVCIWPGIGGTITIDCQYTLPVDSEGGGKEGIGCAKRMQRFVDSGTMNRALS